MTMFIIETLFVGGMLLLLLLTTGLINIRKIFYSLKLPGPIPLPLIGNGLLFLNKSPAENLKIIGRLLDDYGDLVRVWLGPSLIALTKNPKDIELPLPFIGNGLMFLNKDSVENFELIGYFKRTYDDIVAVWLLYSFHVMLSGPKEVEAILSSPKFIEKSDEYKFVKSWLNEGVLLSKGSKWFQRRKILTPAFHFKILEQFVEIFDRQSRVFVETLSKCKPKDEVEMFPLVTLCALDVICESAMGTQINAQQNSTSDYVLTVKNVILREDFLFRFSTLFSEQRSALKTLHDFTDKVINERRNTILNQESGRVDESVDETLGLKRKMAFLDILLQSSINGKPLSNLDIREEVDTFMFEGSTQQLRGTLFVCIASHKTHVQRKCFQEIRDVLGDDTTKPATLNDLNNLNYLDLVIKETLRLFPSVPLIARELHEEVVLGEYTYPKGTNIVIPIYFMGHDPKIFVNPEEFNPERFLVERSTEKTNPYSYIPFSAGPRNCIGQKFALLEIKCLVSKVLRHFEISLAENSKRYPTLLAELILISISNREHIENPVMENGIGKGKNFYSFFI